MSDEVKSQVENYLKIAEGRLKENKESPSSQSTVDELVWQLLEAASGTDENRMVAAREELVKLGPTYSPVFDSVTKGVPVRVSLDN